MELIASIILSDLAANVQFERSETNYRCLSRSITNETHPVILSEKLIYWMKSL